MFNISKECTDEFNQELRDETFVQITFGLVDVDAPSTSTIVDNGHLDFSDVAKLDDDLSGVVSKTYQTLELNRFILDGYNVLYDGKNDLYQGYVGNVISDDNGEFNATKPMITITFSKVTEMAGFTMFFDEYLGNYASEFSLKAYNNSRVVLDKTYNPTDVMFVTPDTIPPCDKLEVVCNKMNVPHRRFRVTKIIYGVIFTLDDRVVTKADLTTKVSVLSQELPQYTFKLQFLDFDKLYAPNNPNSRLRYVDTGQYLRYEIRQQLKDGNVESIPMAYLYTNGEVKTTDINIGEQVDLTGVDALSLMEATYYPSTYVASGRTYKEVLIEILTQGAFPQEYEIDDYLSTLKSRVVLKGLSLKNAFQTVCNAAGCDIYFDRYGKLFVVKHTEDPSDFTFSGRNITGDPTLNRTPLIRNLISKYSNVTIESTATELGKSEIDVSVTNAVVEIEYEPATEITYTKSGLTVVGTPTITPTRFVATVSGTGTITVNGKKLVITESIISKKYNDLGQDLEVYNDFIDSRSDCERYMQAFGEYFSRRSTYTFDNRGFPQLDPLDVPIYETTYDPTMRSLVIENTISFNGSISGKTKVVSFETT